jgi:hypothetical protein
MKPIDLDKAERYNATRPAPNATELAALVAGYQEARGLGVDGMFGPGTRARLTSDIVSLDRAARPGEVTGDAAPPPVNLVSDAIREAWPAFDGPIRGNLPNTTLELNGVYGDPTGGDTGAVKADEAWKRRWIIDRGPDNPLPGAKVVGDGRYVQIHRLVEPYLEEGLRRALLVCELAKPLRIGGFNFRRMRHDTPEKMRREGRSKLLPLSRHCWGCAVDINSDDNDAAEFKPGQTPEPFGSLWLAQWPRGLPKAFVEAMESVGFRWGGRWRGFCDPMHFELAGGPDGVQL